MRLLKGSTTANSVIPHSWLLQAGAVVSVILGIQFTMQVFDAVHIHIGERTGRAVTVMLAEVKSEPGARYLHIDREIGRETMLPIDLETEKIEVEFSRLIQRKDAENGDNATELNCHNEPFPPTSLVNPCCTAFVAPHCMARYRRASRTNDG
jgi:hypothetical protein